MNRLNTLRSAGYTLLISGLGLTCAGFTPLGIMTGSFAAFWQSSIGLVAGGSIFALLQQFGALSYFLYSGLTGFGLVSLDFMAKRQINEPAR